MDAQDDIALLRKYADNGSEAAFQILVSRYIGLVYSAALRQVNDRSLAEEITQVVFIILAKKAARIPEKTILSGWLFKTTRYTALAQMRAAVKRSLRTAAIKEEMQMQNELHSATDEETWQKISPMLDEALASLGEADRQALLLRFFENKSLGEVGARLGASEDTARKRVSRGLEKLRKYFSKHGVNSTPAVIAGTISANSVHPAPAGLAKAMSAVAAAKGATASSTTITLIQGALKLMAWAKAKTIVVIGVVAILAVGTTTMIVQSQNRRVTLPKPQPVAAGETEFPKTSWRFAGYSSPESVFMSCMWAVNNGDTNTLLASVSPNERQRLTRGRQIITAADRKAFAQMTGYRIRDKQIVSEDKVVLAVEAGQDPTTQFLMERFDGEWKFAGRAGK